MYRVVIVEKSMWSLSLSTSSSPLLSAALTFVIARSNSILKFNTKISFVSLDAPHRANHQLVNYSCPYVAFAIAPDDKFLFFLVDEDKPVRVTSCQFGSTPVIDSNWNEMELIGPRSLWWRESSRIPLKMRQSSFVEHFFNLESRHGTRNLSKLKKFQVLKCF